ncbi:MAG: hypothetical protein Kow0090_09270 [Myxococcota bacterium]
MINVRRVLLIENKANDSALIKELIEKTSEMSIEVECAQSLSEGLNLLRNGYFEVVLLNPGLPDSDGLQSLNKLIMDFPDIPVVLITGKEDEEMAVAAVKTGAQDYLVKGKLDGELMIKSLNYAAERLMLRAEMDKIKRNGAQEKDIGALEKFAYYASLSMFSHPFAETSFKEAHPNIFESMVKIYEDILEAALDQKLNGNETDLTPTLRGFAEELVFYRALPKDAVALHTTAVRRKAVASPFEKSRILLEEGRMLFVEIIGLMASCYRNLAAKNTSRELRQ